MNLPTRLDMTEVISHKITLCTYWDTVDAENHFVQNYLQHDSDGTTQDCGISITTTY